MLHQYHTNIPQKVAIINTVDGVPQNMAIHFIGSLLCPIDLQTQILRGNAGPVNAEGIRECYKKQPGDNGTETNTTQLFRLPDQLVSRATLLALNFTPAKAAELWLRWLNASKATAPWDPSSPDKSAQHARYLQQDFLDMILEGIKEESGTTLRLCDHGEDIDYSDATLLEYMTQWGINESFRKEIMVSCCDIPSFGGCSHWVKYIVERQFLKLTRI